MPSGVFGQGDCLYPSQFDCDPNPGQAVCYGVNQVCDGGNDCGVNSYPETNWDENPEWCAYLSANPNHQLTNDPPTNKI